MGIGLIDLVSGILLLAVTVTGGIIRWHLPPGSGHEGQGHGYGFGGGHGEGPKVLLEMNRHGWGDIHFCLAVAFIIVMAIHLYQHRAWLRACLQPKGTTRDCGSNGTG